VLSRIDTLRKILTRLRARAAATQEIRQLTQELVQEDLAQERREELERMRESTLMAGRRPQRTLALYLSGDQPAEKAMTLRPMLILMKMALSDKDCSGNDALRHLQKFLHKEHPNLVTQPECVDFGRLERQHEDLRNPGVHTRPMTRPDCETSRMAVFGFICALWSASPH
jgi:hypothetical protein